MESPLTRRTFLSATGAVAGARIVTSSAAASTDEKTMNHLHTNSSLEEAVKHLVAETPFVDTHEHFCEESRRVRSVLEGDRSLPAPDFGMLLSHYTVNDLNVAGMTAEEFDQTQSWDVSLARKWELTAPYYARCRHTGYQLCLRETLRLLFDEPDLSADNYERISKYVAEHATPGFYARILREKANIEYAHINCLENSLFRETASPDLFGVDLSINGLCVPPNLELLSGLLGSNVILLEDAVAAIDVCFEKYGAKAVAIKSQCAYWRSLNFVNAPIKQAAPVFKRFARGDSLMPEEHEIVQGHLFHHCMRKAAEYGLVVKLHTGYYAGHGGMPLSRVRDNVSDLCPVLQAHPDTNFSLFHIAYPYQDEAIALAKHYKNAYVDMCWAWIINPAASVRFLKEYIMAAPACKLFTFGGDYMPVELSAGHAVVARRGITQAIVALIREGWMEEDDAPALIERIMRGNARETFDSKKKT